MADEFWFALCFLLFFFLLTILSMLCHLLDAELDPFCFFAALWKLLSDKFITWLFNTEKGFKLAYKLGWARAGVDFFDCGVHCDTCPKYAECNSDMRVAFDDVTHAGDPGAGSCS